MRNIDKLWQARLVNRNSINCLGLLT